MDLALDQISLLLVYSAMAVYALAFIAFALDLAKRSADATTASTRELSTQKVAVNAGSAAASGGRGTPTADTAGSSAPAKGPGPLGRFARKFPSERVGVSLTVLAWVFQVIATVLRGIAAERVPWANMYEFAMTGTVLIVGVYLLVLIKIDLRYLGTFMTGLVTLLLGLATVNYYVPVSPLQPALQSPWLVIHVFVASLGTAFLALGFALSAAQLASVWGISRVEEGKKDRFKFLRTLPDAERLEALAYRLNIVGFIFWTFTLIAGAIWAEKAWGRYWGWDTKEVWTFIIWVIYAGYIHARATRGWRGSRSAWLSIIGFAAVMFNFGVVNVFFKGLHAYSGL